MPDTITGPAKPPAKPSNVYLIRWSFGGVRREDIPCHTIYAGHDGETHWWTVRTVTDEWILPSDTITADLPANTALCGIPTASAA